MGDVAWEIPCVWCECCGGRDAKATPTPNAMRVRCPNCDAVYETNALSFVIQPMAPSALAIEQAIGSELDRLAASHYGVAR